MLCRRIDAARIAAGSAQTPHEVALAQVQMGAAIEKSRTPSSRMPNNWPGSTPSRNWWHCCSSQHRVVGNLGALPP